MDTLSQPRSRTASMTENQMLTQMSQQQLQQSIDDNQVNRAMMRSVINRAIFDWLMHRKRKISRTIKFLH